MAGKNWPAWLRRYVMQGELLTKQDKESLRKAYGDKPHRLRPHAQRQKRTLDELKKKWVREEDLQ